MSAEDEVRKASQQFYSGLTQMANGHKESMTDVWSHSKTVSTMHPIGGRQLGWESVKDSFEQVAQLATEGKVELKDQLIRVVGDMACEIGIEQGQFKLNGEQVGINQRVTNVYQRENNGWKIIHHHTDLSPAMMDVLSRLQA
jgi:ketosteroid isomerase-like protein